MSFIENSIAANINRADKVRKHINDLGTAYQNTTTGQTVAGYSATITQINSNTSTLVIQRDNLKKSTAARKNLMKKSNSGLYELLLRLKAGIISQYKSKSPVAKKATALIDKYRAIPTEEPPKTQDEKGNPAPLPKTKSEFQSGYDSKEGILKDIVALVSNQNNYNPVHPDLSLANLQAQFTLAAQLNDDVFNYFSAVVITLTNRNQLYTFLFYDTIGVKKYLLGRFGNEHPNYTIAFAQKVNKLHFVPKEDPRPA